MRLLLDQIEKGVDANLYYLSLFVSLCVPDICGALESENGLAGSDKYKKWIEQYLVKARPDKYGDQLSSEHIWQFRCSLLHQGRSKHNKSEYQRILFFEPGVEIGILGLHCCVVEAKTKDKSLIIDVRQFCGDIINGAKVWLENNQSNKNYIKNYKNLIKRYPKGISPVFGCPVIG
jgi:hypothetical protein